MTPEEQYRAILRNHLPELAVDWVYDYLDRHHVHFHITRQRTSKLGDYRWPQPRHPFHEISVNGDLPPYLFLWVFMHEAAHLETHLKHSAVAPHGHEWQEEYRQLIIVHASFFPAEVQPLLAQYTRRVPLNRQLARQIEILLAPASAAALHLDDLEPHSRFRLVKHPEMLFENLERRRTRWLCRELATGRTYTVSGASEVVLETKT